MTIFIDASALVAIIADEADASVYVERIKGGNRLITSALALWETSLGIGRRMPMDQDLAAAKVDDFVRGAGIILVDISEAEWPIAIDAHIRFGKGNHPARLNFGDCFAYACAKANNARLLYKGDDFAQTDLAWRDDA